MTETVELVEDAETEDANPTAESLAEEWSQPEGAIRAFVEISGEDIETLEEETFSDAFFGEYDSAKEYAEAVVDEYISAHDIELPEMFNGWGNLLDYIDYEHIGRELDMAGMHFEDSDHYTVYVFDF